MECAQIWTFGAQLIVICVLNLLFMNKSIIKWISMLIHEMPYLLTPGCSVLTCNYV